MRNLIKHKVRLLNLIMLASVGAAFIFTSTALAAPICYVNDGGDYTVVNCSQFANADSTQPHFKATGNNCYVATPVTGGGYAISAAGCTAPGLVAANKAAKAPDAQACVSDPAAGLSGCNPSSTEAQQGHCSTAGGSPVQCLFDTYINPFIALLSALVGIFVVIGIITGGIMYTTSAGDPQKAAAAKARIGKVLIALVAYVFLYAFLKFIIPGAAF